MSEPLQSQGKLAYRIDEAVKASGLGRTFLYEHIASGELPSVKIGGRRLILRDELVNFLSRAARRDSEQRTSVSSANKRKTNRTTVAALPGQLEFPWQR